MELVPATCQQSGSGTVSGNILRLESNLPAMDGHFEIQGNTIRSLDTCPNYPPPVEDNSEDISDLIATLPVIEANPAQYFTRKAKYRNEVTNLLTCQGGSCPGTAPSPHLTRLLGASQASELVFEKLTPRGPFLPRR
ncbi:hypothetical protein C8A05DRAFT_39245 [Staphylotrichum tortipilum]|uniref:Uncharacterized protein n=1 Tax=Staphylotrichum tortipilum TaxID=2831512 RepID=A0AAN6RMZ5_9PEZI|nr:hypothetical protein C8A05DRAFT_39245 [Staphylotrichum longicolle]